MGVFSFLPFRLDLSGLGVVVRSQSLLSCAFALTTSSYFLQVFLCPPGSGVLRRSCFFHSSYLKFFCWPSRLLSRVVLFSY